MERKAQLTIIFMTVFIYLVGFGIVIPIMPLLARDFGASPLQVGLLMSVFSAMQFLFSPFWGRLSDRYGRRPIILLCLVGESMAYFAFAFADSLVWLFIARAFAGFFGASLSTASAYISDITPPNERSKGMALIGAAFGLGFLFGPALGGGLAAWGEQISSAPHFGVHFAFISVAVLCLLNFAFGLKFLKESNMNKSKGEKRPSRLLAIKMYLTRRPLGSLISVYFLSTFAMATMESTWILFMGEKFSWGVREVSFGFAFIGLVAVLSQGFLVRRLIPIWGERKMLVTGSALMIVSLFAIPWAPSIAGMAIVMSGLAIGHSFTNPAALGSISLVSNPDEQGSVLGAAQSMSSLGRILGPAVGGWFFGAVTVGSPFLVGSFAGVLGLYLVIVNYAHLPDSGKTQKPIAAKVVT
jgi:DHA1 family tetracycline resistance protein-like MFS transporter